jgi:hypothetical protein
MKQMAKKIKIAYSKGLQGVNKHAMLNMLKSQRVKKLPICCGTLWLPAPTLQHSF